MPAALSTQVPPPWWVFPRAIILVPHSLQLLALAPDRPRPNPRAGDRLTVSPRPASPRSGIPTHACLPLQSVPPARPPKTAAPQPGPGAAETKEHEHTDSPKTALYKQVTRPPPFSQGSLSLETAIVLYFILARPAMLLLFLLNCT